MKNTLSLFLLLACGSVSASDRIKPGQWVKITDVVFKHRDQAWVSQFNQKYQTLSEDGVRELARQFDFDEENPEIECWLESAIPELSVTVNKERIYGLKPGRCTDIICQVRREMLAEVERKKS